MRCGRYRFICTFDEDAKLPPFKGSTLRGAFGWALKRVTCALKTQQCSNCILRETCVYCKIFESLPSNNLQNRMSPPHPFVMEPPDGDAEFFPAGADLSFNIFLFGFANELLPYFVYAFQEMGKRGLGRRLSKTSGAFHLVKVCLEDQVIYDPDDGVFRAPSVPELAAPQPSRRTADATSSLTVRVETPLRLKFGNRFVAELPFHVLVRGMLRRISVLNNHFGSGEPALDYRGLVARAEQVETESSALRWFDWRRYSNRQEQSMLMGGVIGSVTYRGALDEFLPLLKYCEIVHVGKATAFGLGKIRVVGDAGRRPR
ncbi:MAG: CRISPR system precrRNA processing endoribonuclease RAMP protein Cas6 [Desulfomonilaceae bacterium]